MPAPFRKYSADTCGYGRLGRWRCRRSRRRGGGAVAACGDANRCSSSRPIGPRRYDSVHRVSNTTGSCSCTLCIRNTRLPQRRQRRVERLPIESAGDALETVEHARLVALGLQLAEKPGAGVRQRLVVEIDRVLRREHDADAKRACLFEQRQQRQLSMADWRPAAGSRTLRPCRSARAASSCRSAGASTRAAALSSSDTTSIRSASPRCAIETMAMRGLPVGA